MCKLERPFVWLKRFRHRCGYGVHSPFAFEFITCVIYEKTPYYAYRELKIQRREARKTGEVHDIRYCRKIAHLLFRLVNRIQPDTIVDAGPSSYTARYLHAAKKNTKYICIQEDSGHQPVPSHTIDFLYLHTPDNPVFVEKIFKAFVGHTTSESLFVIEGIYSSPAMKDLWKEFLDDDRVGITFDLYSLGILFFDTSKLKQHYIVNF